MQTVASDELGQLLGLPRGGLSPVVEQALDPKLVVN
eukprot:COSAG01_NODE_24924_length_761_cov_1.649547_2_plen_35_part_01